MAVSILLQTLVDLRASFKMASTVEKMMVNAVLCWPCSLARVISVHQGDDEPLKRPSDLIPSCRVLYDVNDSRARIIGVSISNPPRRQNHRLRDTAPSSITEIVFLTMSMRIQILLL